MIFISCFWPIETKNLNIQIAHSYYEQNWFFQNDFEMTSMTLPS